MQPLVNLLQRLDDPLMAFSDARHGRRLVDQLQHLARHRARQRITAVGGAVGADIHHLRQIFAGQHRADRETAAQRLGGGEHVRRHAVVHIGVERTGAAHAALHFVKNQQRLVLIAQRAQAA